MSRRRAKSLQRGRWAVAGAGLAMGLWLAGPPALRSVTAFRVRAVEVMGARQLSSRAVVAALRLGPGASLFDPSGALAERVRALPGVLDARIERRLPGTLRVVLREAEPVAFVPGARGLVPVDVRGVLLPFDPARTPLDLPIVVTSDSAVLGVLGLVQAVDAGLYQEITVARRLARGDVALELGSRRVLVARDAGPEVIQAVVLVRRDLAARKRPYAELDARYAGQVVVRRRLGMGGAGATGRGAGGGAGA
jgi:cell division septal protein FtsQ